MPYRRTLTLLLVGGCLITAPAVAAQPGADGISVDPSSPAGVEYALPLHAAREAAAGSQAATASAMPEGKRAAPLFGAGAERDEATASRSSAGREQGRSASRSLAARSGAGAEAATTAAGDGLHSGATIALGALLVLVTGGVIGLVLRRPTDR